MRAAKVVLRLAEIVGYAHRLNPPVVHRDLKPSNILTAAPAATATSRSRSPTSASAASRRPRRSGRRAGASASAPGSTSLVRGSCTPLYASPEQMRGADPDPRDDVHALGVIWYQILTGNLGAGRPGGQGGAPALRPRARVADWIPG